MCVRARACVCACERTCVCVCVYVQCQEVYVQSSTLDEIITLLFDLLPQTLAVLA